MSFVAPAATAITQIASPFIAAKGQKQAAAAEQAADERNAQLSDIQAQEIITSGEITQEEMAGQALILRSAQESAYAKAGVMLSGSPLEVMLHSATDFEFDMAIERYNTAVKVSQAQSQAQVDRYSGQLARQSGKVQAGMTLLGGIPKVIEGVGTLANRFSRPAPTNPYQIGQLPGYGVPAWGVQ